MRHFAPALRDIVLAARVARELAEENYRAITSKIVDSENDDETVDAYDRAYVDSGLEVARVAELEAERALVLAMFDHLDRRFGPREETAFLRARWTSPTARARAIDLALKCAA